MQHPNTLPSITPDARTEAAIRRLLEHALRRGRELSEQEAQEGQREAAGASVTGRPAAGADVITAEGTNHDLQQ